MDLYIDTTDFNKATFALLDNKKISKQSFKIDPHKSHETIQKLGEFLNSKKLRVESLKKIIVNKGPGSYTGVRVGVSIAMALGLAWNVPVKAINKNSFSKYY